MKCAFNDATSGHKEKCFDNELCLYVNACSNVHLFVSDAATPVLVCIRRHSAVFDSTLERLSPTKAR